eukprot:CAMPEP_0194767110 /NCGR_PEP_ID=MMETSP0323_2-20130528/34544_1 /TAXON_ID=2866 ORGANISM="Crypthecodinium cohnii, Strain Seligo" /NCGR_SAMPLE_ID=MMETSP0323_2 /ASSEMBLY_ACC=CAM_ASM_000346 /LENGTH=71 /DNA_ID=CAMNT_0039698579 /DNA_START=11 /DNA_END=222 /DNA_ORIENTATION=-
MNPGCDVSLSGIGRVFAGITEGKKEIHVDTRTTINIMQTKWRQLLDEPPLFRRTHGSCQTARTTEHHILIV